jgi:hypothetical protein
MSNVDPEPRIGALLRLSHELVHNAVFDQLGAAGYPELREAFGTASALLIAFGAGSLFLIEARTSSNCA